MQDTWSDDQGVLQLDNRQDCNNFKIKHMRKLTTFTFQREFDTCDENDYVIEVAVRRAHLK